MKARMEVHVLPKGVLLLLGYVVNIGNYSKALFRNK